jgi:hypothetical protein
MEGAESRAITGDCAPKMLQPNRPDGPRNSPVEFLARIYEAILSAPMKRSNTSFESNRPRDVK